MNFLSIFREEINIRERWAHNEYHKAIRENDDRKIAYYGTQYDILRDVRKALDVPQFENNITDIFEEISFNITKKLLKDLTINKSIKTWIYQDAPNKYLSLDPYYNKETKGWISFVPKELQGTIDDFIRKNLCYVVYAVQKIEVPWEKEFMLYIIKF